MFSLNNVMSFVAGSGVTFVLTYVTLIQRLTRIETKLEMHLKESHD